jgi:hypothetical protein
MEYLKEVLKECWILILLMGIIAIPVLSYLSRRNIDKFYDNFNNGLEEPQEPKAPFYERDNFAQSSNDSEHFPEY